MATIDKSISDLELHIEIDKDFRVEYKGARAQLEAEGIIPEGMEWPVGKDSVHWQAKGLEFWLRRRRPSDMKGPMKLWLEGDYWELSFSPIGQRYWDSLLRQKARELNEMLFEQSEEGRRRWHATLQRVEIAAKDKGFQAFLAKVPALAEPAPRRRGKKAKASHESANN